MKHVYFLFSIFLLFLNSCKNDDDSPKNPVDKLPPATQTGEQTFGCLINGEAFIPNSFGSGRPNAFYQFVDGAYTFVVSSSSGGGNSFIGVGVGGIDIQPLEEIAYNLIEEQSGSTFGKVIEDVNSYSTSSNNHGFLNITNLDTENFIISGTFEFTVFDNDNNEIKITEGRFDVKYTN